MTVEEVKKIISNLKEEGYDDDMIMNSFLSMFEEGEIDFGQLEALTHVMGYELTEEFKNEFQSSQGKKNN